MQENTTSNKLDLQAPYNNDWDIGYLQINRDNRKHVYLYKRKTNTTSAKRSTTQYARYLMATNLGRYLTATETVDHINNDKIDDRLENLQVLSRADNNKKQAKLNGKAMVRLICGSCGVEFSKERRNTHLVIKTKRSTYCSRACAGKKLQPSIILEEFKEYLE